MSNPAKFIKILSVELVSAEMRLLSDSATNPGTLKRHVHPRFTGMPLCGGETFFQRIPTLGCQKRLIAVSGVVIRTGATKMVESSNTFECVRCRFKADIKADLLQYGLAPKPAFCPAVVDGDPCRGTKFVLVESQNGCEDYQEIRIQENTSQLELGAVPKSLPVVLQNDLVDSCKAGDQVIIIGTLECRWKPLKSGNRGDLDLVFVANSVQIHNHHVQDGRIQDGIMSMDTASQARAFWARHWQEQRLQARNHIISSFCPQIYGLFLVKLAVLLTLIGGAQVQDEADHMGARRHRKEGHLLLVGDPGTAKSQFLVAAAKLSMRSVMTTGSGSTNAGLTVAAVKDGGDWMLDAGALVLADKGLCCIDEFNALRQHDRTAIHEAMEQQTLSVAKAGLVCKLNTRCSIIAACNAKGKFDEGESISANTALASPLLSRFDLILVLLDQRNHEWDRRLSLALLDHSCRSRPVHINRPGMVREPQWDLNQLKSYIGHVKTQRSPRMTFAARIILAKYYQLQRQADLRDAARTTIRLLESLIRLVQAHAKLMYQDKVLASDAVAAIVLMETSLQARAVLGDRPDIYAEAPEDPEQQYQGHERDVLRRLEINPAVFAKNGGGDEEPLPALNLDSDAEELLRTQV